MVKAIGHFITITRHRHLVIKHCKKAGVFWQGLRHDLSKYSFTEFKPGARYYTGKHSPNEDERALYGYSLAWIHHKGRNKHHFEYWTDVNVETKNYEPVEMPLKYLIEMFCDRIAASKIYQGDKYTDASALNYYNRGRARDKIHQNTAATLEVWLKMLAEKGEKETFAYVRKLYRESRRKKK